MAIARARGAERARVPGSANLGQPPEGPSGAQARRLWHGQAAPPTAGAVTRRHVALVPLGGGADLGETTGASAEELSPARSGQGTARAPERNRRWPGPRREVNGRQRWQAEG